MLNNTRLIGLYRTGFSSNHPHQLQAVYGGVNIPVEAVKYLSYSEISFVETLMWRKREKSGSTVLEVNGRCEFYLLLIAQGAESWPEQVGSGQST